METPFGLLSVVNEPGYSFESQDNVRSYEFEVLLTRDRPTSIHGITLNGRGIIIVGAVGGCSSVHEHSAVVLDDKLYLAVGDHVTCLSLSRPHRLVWSTQVDMATCFGIYWEHSRGALISHGELEISRLSLEGLAPTFSRKAFACCQTMSKQWISIELCIGLITRPAKHGETSSHALH
jgi:hypothetical protein